MYEFVHGYLEYDNADTNSNMMSSCFKARRKHEVSSMQML